MGDDGDHEAASLSELSGSWSLHDVGVMHKHISVREIFYQKPKYCIFGAHATKRQVSKKT